MKGTIVVTGGAGYVGSHTAKALKAAGYKPITFDNLSTGHKELVKFGPFEKGDITDTKWLIKKLKKYKPLAVMHFAGLISVAESVHDPEPYYHHNVAGTLSLLAAMRESGVKQLIFSSSCAVHGIPASMPIREDMPCAPVNPYGRTKYMMELAIHDVAAAYGLSAAILRYFNASGADADGEIGELHEPETHLIPLAIEAAMTGKPFQLFGADYATKDGSAVRDYIHVTDLAEAHVLALDYLHHHSGAHVFNVGTGIGISVKEVVAAVEKVTGKKLNAVISPRRAGDAPELYADPALAQNKLGFTAKHSDIMTIVETAYAWHRKSL